MRGSFFPPYRISHRTAESLKANEPAKWAAAEDDLTAATQQLPRKMQFTEDQAERLVGLAMLVELGVVKRTFPEPREIPLVSEPVAVAVGEPTTDEELPETMEFGGATDFEGMEGWP